MRIKHYIITRNLYPDDYPFYEERLALIKKYTIPSLANQTCKDFEWILTGDSGLIESDFLGINHSIQKSFKKYIQRNASSFDIVITTRLDNDDYLLPNFVTEVQSMITGISGNLLVDLRGYRADLRDGCFYEDTSYLKMPSPFISLVEHVVSSLEIKTVFFDQHTLMAKHYNYQRLNTIGWMQVIHDRNKIMNRPKDDVSRRGVIVEPPEFLKSLLN